ncbi:hypothetical protein [Pectobacterium polaris]|uniref:hypothetical protein n=1 Tax=Pectobacterium polaris TaxID=2042057 RepID=UPI0032E39AB9
MTDFFSSKNVKEQIGIYINNLKFLHARNEFHKSRNDHCIKILESMLNHPVEWSKFTEFNVGKVGGRLLEQLSKGDNDNDSIDLIFSILFRFLMESYFNQSDDLDVDMINFKDFAFEKKNSFTHESRMQIDYAINEMPFSLFREKYHRDDIQYFIKAAGTEQYMREKIAEWDNEIKIKMEKVEALKTNLDEKEIAYNFVGLYHGYDSLSKEKKSELKRAFAFTLSLSLLVLIPFVVDVFLVYKGIVKFESPISLLSFVPVFVLTFIFIYYFRIALANYISIKAQVNQIELRKTLCTFIQTYSEYAKEMKTNDGNSLEKFEAIIFSNIMPSEDKIPSTFDGVEQIAKLIESVKK